MALKTSVLTLALLGALLFIFPVSPANACGTCGCGGCSATADTKATAGKDIVDTAVAAGKFNTLVAAVKAAGLVDTLKSDGPFTVFAPVDSAFEKLPAGTVEALLKDKSKLASILTYHVVPGRLTAEQVLGMEWIETVQGQSLRVQTSGDEVTIDGARILATDVSTSNGIIHVIDTVVLPRKDIVDTAVEAKSFGTLLAAAKAAGLVETLKSKGPFTVFAPSDAAFAKLPAGTVEALLKDPAKLKAILLYHVVPGRVLSTDLPVGSTSAATAEGRSLSVVRTDTGSVTVNGARVETADVLAGNGVIHVIDTVILPR
jgi:transforming growth factor-beta-induced protein